MLWTYSSAPLAKTCLTQTRSTLSTTLYRPATPPNPILHSHLTLLILLTPNQERARAQPLLCLYETNTPSFLLSTPPVLNAKCACRARFPVRFLTKLRRVPKVSDSSVRPKRRFVRKSIRNALQNKTDGLSTTSKCLRAP